MKQVVQPISGGPVRVVEVPRPVCGPTEVLVQTVASVISPGTERAVTALAQSNLLAKAKARPDLVRQVIRKARTEGLRQTSRVVGNRLRGDVPLGYSAAGTVVEVGEYVSGVVPGQLVATGGAGRANHAEYQVVPGLLCAVAPRGVEPEHAAFATIGSVALHGLRLAQLGPGSRVVVIGLGLIGQLAVRLAQASGYQVAAIDVSQAAVDRARAAGALALVEAGDETTESVWHWSRGRGADAVVIAASGSSSAVVARTPALCRDRAAVVVVGDVGLDLDRTPFYDKELSLRFARSYGPGRYEQTYEEWGVDYPPGYVRWTEGRNLEAFLDLLAARRLEVGDLVTHRFALERAPDAYTLMEQRTEPTAGVVLTYDTTVSSESFVPVRSSRRVTVATKGVGLIGAGAFASSVLIPNVQAAGLGRLVAVASASGLSARRMAERFGFEHAISDVENLIASDDVDVVIIATPHSTHAELVVKCLEAGKHVFCEKPLALTFDELAAVENAWRYSSGHLMVDFNRRWSEPVTRIREHFRAASGPLVLTYRVSAGPIPPGHWYGDRREGGRLIGEVCHFIDTCNAIVDSRVVSVSAVASGRGERLLADDLAITLAYEDASIATITYAAGGHPSTPKERLEVLGGRQSAVLDDFRFLALNGARVRVRKGKGHLEGMEAFARAVTGSDQEATERLTLPALHSMKDTLRAAAALTDKT